MLFQASKLLETCYSERYITCSAHLCVLTSIVTCWHHKKLSTSIKVMHQLHQPTYHGWAQVITTFLGTLLTGSFLNQITAFLDNPKGIVNTLGNSAPQTATFFMTYILIQAFIKHPLQLLRLPGLIIFWLKYRLATTPRQKAAVWQDTHLKYGTNVISYSGVTGLLLHSAEEPTCCIWVASA